MGFIRCLHAPSGETMFRDCIFGGDTTICFSPYDVEIVNIDVAEDYDVTFFRGVLIHFDRPNYSSRVRSLIRGVDLDALAEMLVELAGYVGDYLGAGCDWKYMVVAVMDDRDIYSILEEGVRKLKAGMDRWDVATEIGRYVAKYSPKLLVCCEKWALLTLIEAEAYERCRHIEDMSEYFRCFNKEFERLIKTKYSRPEVIKCEVYEYGEYVTGDPCIIIRKYREILPEIEHEELIKKCKG